MRTKSYGSADLVSNTSEHKYIYDGRSYASSALSGFPFDGSFSGKRMYYAYYVLFLISIAHFSNQLNKYIINYTKSYVQEDIEFSESEYGLLVGYSFGIVYVIFGIPAGIFSDKYSRKNLLLSGLILWSAMICVQGAAKTYVHLLIGRIGLGIGEASFSPSALALIAEYFPSDRRAIPNSIFSFGVYVGTGLASILSNAASEESIGWRWLYYSLGLSGLLVGVAIFFSLEEPTRMVHEAKSIQSSSTHGKGRYKHTFLYVLSLNSAWKITLAAGIRSFGSYVLTAFVPDYLSEIYPDRQYQIRYTYGVISILAGCSSSLLGGIINNFWYSSNSKSPSYIAAISSCLACPALFFMIYAPDFFSPDNERLAFICSLSSLFVVYLIGECWGGASILMLQGILPTEMQASGFALYFFFLTLIGGAGPEIVGIILQLTDGYEKEIITSFLIVPYLLSSGLFYFSGRRLYDDELSKELYEVGGHQGTVSKTRRRIFAFFISLLICTVLVLVALPFAI